MNKKLTIMIGAAAMAFTSVAFNPASAAIYMRSGDKVNVYTKGGKLYCTFMSGSKKGFEMCHGMKKVKTGVYKGAKMKHPTFPGTFDGTVTYQKGKVKVQGCFLGMCPPSETWTKAK